MHRYFINDHAQLTGEHVVHEEHCKHFRYIVSKTDIGYHPNCIIALIIAKQHYDKVDGCKDCIPRCHDIKNK